MGTRDLVSLSRARDASQAEMEAAPDLETVRAHLACVLSSTSFVRASRLSKFLRFAVAHALEGEPINEHQLASGVFDRRGDFDPRIDPIVRVEARRLRDKLKLYYRTEGRSSPVAIDFPRGSYLPVFRWRKGGAASLGSAGGRKYSIEILEFPTSGDGADQDAFTTGLRHELLHALTRTGSIRVFFHAMGLRCDGLERARKTAGDYLLCGQAHVDGNQVRVHSHLVSAQDGACLWSQCYDRALDRAFDTQRGIAVSIAMELHSYLTGIQRRGPSGNRARDSECADLCEIGRHLAGRRTAHHIGKAVECFRRAILLDPDSARAYAGLADCYTLMAWYGHQPPPDALRQAKEAALQALRIDRFLAEAHLSLALVREFSEWDSTAAKREFSLAAQYEPTRASTWLEFGLFLARMGALTDGQVNLARARSLAPQSAVATANEGVGLYFQGDYQRAARKFNEALDLDEYYFPARFRLGLACLQQGMTRDALDNLEEARALSGGSPMTSGVLGYVLGLLGQRDDAERLCQGLLEQSRDRFVTPIALALASLGMGDEAAAAGWLAMSQREHVPLLMDWRVDPLYRPILGNGRLLSAIPAEVRALLICLRAR